MFKSLLWWGWRSEVPVPSFGTRRADMCSVLHTVGEGPYLPYSQLPVRGDAVPRAQWAICGIWGLCICGFHYQGSGWKPSFPPDLSSCELKVAMCEAAPRHQLQVRAHHECMAQAWVSSPRLCNCCQNLEMQEGVSCFATDSYVTIVLMTTKLELKEVTRGKWEFASCNASECISRKKICISINRLSWNKIAVVWQL